LKKFKPVGLVQNIDQHFQRCWSFSLFSYGAAAGYDEISLWDIILKTLFKGRLFICFLDFEFCNLFVF
jgi:hypothetical protein